nr:hypothetical protein [Venatoribacter cucullus]
MKSAIVILSSLLLLTACGGGGGGSDSDSSNDAQPRYTVSATAGAGGTVFPPLQSLDQGQQGQIHIMPSTGYDIGSVDGCSGTLNGNLFITAPVNNDCSITATFVAQTGDQRYTVNASAIGGGSVSPSGQKVQQGTTGVITVTPDTGYTIDQVIGCNGTLSGNTYTTSPATGNCEVVATFRQNQYSVTATAGNGGSVTPTSQTIRHGSTGTLILTPDTGYAIESVSGCNGTLNGNTFITGPVTEACNITATFSTRTDDVQYTINANASVGGSVSPSGQQVQQGATGVITVTPDTGYTIDQVSGCNGTLSGNTFTTGPMTAACAVTATFSLNQYEVTAAAGNGGSVTPTSQSIGHGSTTTLSVIPDTGYAIDQVSGCNGTLSGNTFTTGPVTAACVVTATFSQNQYSVTATAGNGGSVTPASQSIGYGSTGTLILTPDAGYAIASVSGCNGTLSGNTFTIGPVTGPCQINATFTNLLQQFTASAGDALIDLSWQAVLDTDVSRYCIYHATSPDIDPKVPASYETGGRTCFNAPLTQYRLDNLNNMTTYYVAVTAELPRRGLVLISHERSATPIPATPWATRLHYGNLSVAYFTDEPSGDPFRHLQLSWPEEPDADYALYVATQPTTNLDHYAADGATLHLNVQPPFVLPDVIKNKPLYLALEKNGHLIGWTSSTPTEPQLNGEVLTQAMLNDVRYVGGSFTHIAAPTGNATALPPAGSGNEHALAFPLVNGTALAIASDGQGGWYLGGNFTEVDGQPRARLAHVNALGQLTDWNPGANRTVLTLAVHNNVLYAGGEFTQAGGQPRNYLAAFTVANGSTSGNSATLLDWNPGANYWVNTLAVHNNVLYAGGSFSQAGGQPRNRLAAFTVATPGDAATLLDWNPGASGRVNTLAVHNNVLYAGGWFTQVGGQTRNYLAAFTVANGATSGNTATLLDWNPGANGEVRTLAVHNNVLYAGGGFTQAGGQPRERLAAFTVANVATPGTLLDWNPGANRSVETIAVHDNVLYVGGQFTLAGGQTRNRLAAFTVANGATPGTLLDWNPGVDGRIAALAVSPGAILAGGDGGLVGRGRHQAQPYLAAFDRQGNLLPWNPGPNSAVSTLAVHNNVLYAGGWFSMVGGQTRAFLVAFSVPNGTTPGETATLLDWNSGVSGTVRTLAVHNNVLYAGGEFTRAGGPTRQTRNTLAAFSLADGALLNWNPGANGSVNTLAVHNNVLYAGGRFTEAGGQPRERLAAFTVANGATPGNPATLLDWNPGTNDEVRTLAVHNNVLYAGGWFTQAGGQTRNRLAAFTVANVATPGTLLDWNPGANNWVETLAVHDNVLYAGGYFTQAGGQTRYYLAAFTVANGATSGDTGTVLNWNPGSGSTVRSLIIDNGQILGGREESSDGNPLFTITPEGEYLP